MGAGGVGEGGVGDGGVGEGGVGDGGVGEGGVGDGGVGEGGVPATGPSASPPLEPQAAATVEKPTEMNAARTQRRRCRSTVSLGSWDAPRATAPRSFVVFM